MGYLDKPQVLTPNFSYTLTKHYPCTARKQYLTIRKTLVNMEKWINPSVYKRVKHI